MVFEDTTSFNENNNKTHPVRVIFGRHDLLTLERCKLFGCNVKLELTVPVIIIIMFMKD
jgi:hypothetical protein